MIINTLFELNIDFDILTDNSKYIQCLISNNYKENKQNLLEIMVPTIITETELRSFETTCYIINEFKINHSDKNIFDILKKNKSDNLILLQTNISAILTHTYTIIHTLNYLCMDEYLEIYLNHLISFIGSINYKVQFDNCKSICYLLDSCNWESTCETELINKNTLNDIFLRQNININYLDIGRNIVKLNVSEEIKCSILAFWSNKIKEIECISNSSNIYFDIDFLFNNDFNSLVSSNSFWDKACDISSIWGPFIKYKLPENCVISGGFIPLCIKNLEKKNYSDIDLWIYGDNYQQCMDTFDTLIDDIKIYLLSNNINNYFITIKKSILTFHIENEIDLQIIFTDKKSPYSILNNFDMDYLQSFIIRENYDTSKILLSVPSLCCYNCGITNTLKKIDLIQNHRIMKTIEKGFSINGILNSTIQFIDISFQWQEYKNKYIDIYPYKEDGEIDIVRTRVLLKSIYKTDYVINSIDDIAKYYDYIPFELSHYIDKNTYHLDYLNNNKFKYQSVILSKPFINAHTYLKFNKDIYINNVPIAKCISHSSIKQDNYKLNRHFINQTDFCFINKNIFLELYQKVFWSILYEYYIYRYQRIRGEF